MEKRVSKLSDELTRLINVEIEIMKCHEMLSPRGEYHRGIGTGLRQARGLILHEFGD